MQVKLDATTIIKLLMSVHQKRKYILYIVFLSKTNSTNPLAAELRPQCIDSMYFLDVHDVALLFVKSHYAWVCVQERCYVGHCALSNIQMGRMKLLLILSACNPIFRTDAFQLPYIYILKLEITSSTHPSQVDENLYYYKGGKLLLLNKPK